MEENACQSAGNWQKEMKGDFWPADIFLLNLIQLKGSSCTTSGNLGKKKTMARS